jgi:hypothetical protein
VMAIVGASPSSLRDGYGKPRTRRSALMAGRGTAAALDRRSGSKLWEASTRAPSASVRAPPRPRPTEQGDRFPGRVVVHAAFSLARGATGGAASRNARPGTRRSRSHDRCGAVRRARAGEATGRLPLRPRDHRDRGSGAGHQGRVLGGEHGGKARRGRRAASLVMGRRVRMPLRHPEPSTLSIAARARPLLLQRADEAQ